MFQEYPKWLHLENRESVLVQNAEHEADVLEDAGFTAGGDAPVTREDLIIAAKMVGLAVNPRWSNAKLQSELDKAE